MVMAIPAVAVPGIVGAKDGEETDGNKRRKRDAFDEEIMEFSIRPVYK
jgi:hypothetical protein